MHDYYKSPWFLTLVAFVIWGCGYIMGDDNRIEREISQVKHCQWERAK